MKAAHREMIAGFVLPLLVQLTLTATGAMKEPTGVRESSPTLQLRKELPNGGVLLLYEQFLSYPFRLRDQAKTRTATVYFLETRRPGESKRTRIWEEGYWINFAGGGLGKPRGFTLGIAEGYTSPIGLAYWESSEIRFFEIDPRTARTSRFLALVHGQVGKERLAKDFSALDSSKPDRQSVPFGRLFPSYPWNAINSNPPSIRKISREQGGWNMTIAVGQPEMHLQLRDGTKEWVWLNKPPAPK